MANWVAVDRSSDDAVDASIAFAGSMLGIGLSCVPVILGVLVDSWSLVAVGGGVGVVVTLLLAAPNAKRAALASGRGRLKIALKMAAQAIVIGDLGVSAMLVLGSAAGNVTGLVAGAVLVPLMGMVIFGLPAFALALAVYVPWAMAMGWLGRHVWHVPG